VSPVKYEVGFFIPEGDILHNHCSGNLKSYKNLLFYLHVLIKVLDNINRSLNCCGSGLCPSSGILKPRKHSVWKLGSFPYSGEGKKTPALLGPSDRANLND
jgi:5-methylcytosine-specific restriction endonuclease McrBC GTP-binding regulatory subunit McrB